MSRRARTGVIAGVLLAAALLVGASLAQRGMGGYGGGGSMGWGMMGNGYRAWAPDVLDWDGARALIERSADGARVDPRGNTVTFTGASVTLEVIAVQPDEPDTTFEIAGLVDPTVRVQRGALVTLELVNMDYGEDMPHGLVITRLPPPYPYVVMPMMSGASGGVPPLAPRSSADLRVARYAASSLQFRAVTPGTYYYLCQVPGHARDGMYGRLIVE